MFQANKLGLKYEITISQSEFRPPWTETLNETLVCDVYSQSMCKKADCNHHKLYGVFSLTWSMISFSSKTKENVCIRIEFNSRRISWGHQHGCRFFVQEHQPPWRHVKTLHCYRPIFDWPTVSDLNVPVRFASFPEMSPVKTELIIDYEFK